MVGISDLPANGTARRLRGPLAAATAAAAFSIRLQLAARVGPIVEKLGGFKPVGLTVLRAPKPHRHMIG